MEPAGQILLEPIETGAGLEHLVVDVAVGRTVVLVGREPRGLNG